MKKVIKDNKKIIFGIIIGLIFGSVGVYAGSNMYANSISVNAPAGSNLGSDATLQSAIDDLYSIAANNDEIERRLSALEKNSLTLDSLYPVGSIYISTTITSASDVAKKFGGTWEAYASGKTLVGVDTNDTSFNTANKIGGSSSTVLSVDNLPEHTHSISHTHTTPATSTGIESTTHSHYFSSSHSHGAIAGWNFSIYTGERSTETVGAIAGSGFKISQVPSTGSWHGIGTTAAATVAGWTGTESANHVHTLPAMTTNSQSTTTSGSTGKGTSFSNLQPYITVYMYKRTK